MPRCYRPEYEGERALTGTQHRTLRHLVGLAAWLALVLGWGWPNISLAAGPAADDSSISTFTPVPDTSGLAENYPPIANDDTLSTIDGMPIEEDGGVVKIPVADLLANDDPGAPNGPRTLRLGAISSLLDGRGTLRYDPASDPEHIYFTPEEDFYGKAIFEYTLEDYGTTDGSGTDHHRSERGGGRYCRDSRRGRRDPLHGDPRL